MSNRFRSLHHIITGTVVKLTHSCTRFLDPNIAISFAPATSRESKMGSLWLVSISDNVIRLDASHGILWHFSI